ncbi:MAG: SDR family oxidoreductase [Actinomycetota bacterium]|nr:SDR family oxidoreductase [Actinomycetota bacterium]
MSVEQDCSANWERSAIVSGGARGLGRAAALALGAAGHPVCVNDTGVDLAGRAPDPAPAEAAASEIVARGGRAMVSTVDARTSRAARRLVADVEGWAGAPATIFVHAAGTLRDGMVHKASDEDWAEVLGSHLSVAVELTRALSGTIRARRFGRIVYLGGAAGLVGSVGQAGYAVAKAALFGLTRAVALEMAGRDVCVNYLVPFAFTRMTESIPAVTDQLAAYLRTAALARPDDLAALLCWLCSDAAAGVTGQVLGARGAELALWSQPRPHRSLIDEQGWCADALSETALPALEPLLVPLESEFDLFAAPPVAVMQRSTI